jgi:allophanate hydrolase
VNSLLIDELSAAYRNGSTTPAKVLEYVLQQIDAAPEHGVWITRLSRQQVMQFVKALEGKAPESLPLYGIPFAIKDNIDLAGVPTTAGCPAYAFTPERSATVVQKLIDAGAIPVGKTNLDQFATGLVGTRSPYGVCHNSFNPAFISGGSSSGSAVAVASGLVSFALGTDTAGSGRVPASFNNLIGLKPTFGLLSTSGVVPACRSLDCVSIFTLSAADVDRVFQCARGHDALDAYSRRSEDIRRRPVGAVRRSAGSASRSISNRSCRRRDCCTKARGLRSARLLSVSSSPRIQMRFTQSREKSLQARLKLPQSNCFEPSTNSLNSSV